MSSIESSNAMISRRAVLNGVAAAFAVSSAGFATGPAIAAGKGTQRSLSLINNHTAERLSTVYWVDGDYVPEALEALNHILRDWRSGERREMDVKAIEILAAAHKLLDTTEPFEIISGYRSAATNAALRTRNLGVASKSYHVTGQAVDVSLKGRSAREIAQAGLSLKAGGVGTYTRSGFTHLDSGPVRSWGR